MQTNRTTAETQIGSYRVIIDNGGCLHIHMAGFQLQLKLDETLQLLDFLINNNTVNAGGVSTTISAGDPPADKNDDL